ncbi:hypothetical protein Ddc_11182 [Ditylenchus destructor]|nr:hypothetical protein Ddc_11182 [Ditylenchus destructor]
MDNSSAAVNTAGSVPLPPLFPNFSPFPITNNLLRGTGQLTWLSPKAGLITCSKPVPATVSFQLKDFCDAGVTDLTSVLRVGFRLAFHAVAASDSNDWIANHVAPIGDSDPTLHGLNDNKELDLEAIESNLGGAGAHKAHNKDPYSLEMEVHSLSFLLSIFHKNCVHFIPLSTLHSRISNSGKEELYRYIGSSSLKRRQFIERRSYIFHIAENDVVFLQPPEIYTAVCLLSGYLLAHGGVTSSDALFGFFNNCATIPPVLKESISKNRQNFMHLLARHPFAFAPFPSQFYVAVRRNLPYFDYTTYIKKNFPACVYPRPNQATPAYMPPARPNNMMAAGPFHSFDATTGPQNDAMPNGSTPLFGPTTPMTPLFHDDNRFGNATAAPNGNGNGMLGRHGSQSAVWPNDIGYFDNHGVGHQPPPQAPLFNGSSHNNGGHVQGHIPIVGGNGPPMGGRSASFNVPHNGTHVEPLLKFDLLKRPSDLGLIHNGTSSIGPGGMLSIPLAPRKMGQIILVETGMQTDKNLWGEQANTNSAPAERVERAVGPDSPVCQCKCTCQKSAQETNQVQTTKEQEPKSIQANPKISSRAYGLASFDSSPTLPPFLPTGIENNMLPGFQPPAAAIQNKNMTDFSSNGLTHSAMDALIASNIRQRSISVQDQAIFNQQNQAKVQPQRPLFSAGFGGPLIGAGNGDGFGQYRLGSDSFFTSIGFPMPQHSASQSPNSMHGAGNHTANSSPNRGSCTPPSNMNQWAEFQNTQGQKMSGTSAESNPSEPPASTSSSSERLFNPFDKVLPFELHTQLKL